MRISRWIRKCVPILPLAMSVLALIDAVAAFDSGRLGRGAFKAFSGVAWLFIAYMAYESYKRVLTDSGK
jgi:lipopolysaccharide export LptBFGC system permease protein LptF